MLASNAGIGPISPLDDLRAMVDVNVKGLLHGIAAALPILRHQGSGHFAITLSTASLHGSATMAVHAATKNAARTITEGLRPEANGTLGVSPGFVAMNFAGSMTDPTVRASIQRSMDAMALPPRRSRAPWPSPSSSPLT